MSRLTTRTVGLTLASVCLGLVITACGGLPLEAPDGIARSTEYNNVGGDVLAQAPSTVVEEPLPGCEALEGATLDSDAVLLMRYPGSHGLVVVIDRHGAPICVDTRDAALGYIGRLEAAVTISGESAFTSTRGHQDDDPVPVSPAREGDPRGDDPVPVKPDEGGESQGQQPRRGGTAPAGDDPVPVKPDEGGESQGQQPSDGGTDPAGDDPVPIKPQPGTVGPPPTNGAPASPAGGTQPADDDPVPVRTDEVTARPGTDDELGTLPPMIDPRYIQPLW